MKDAIYLSPAKIFQLLLSMPQIEENPLLNKEMLFQLKSHVDLQPLVVDDFNNPLSPMERPSPSRQELNKYCTNRCYKSNRSNRYL